MSKGGSNSEGATDDDDAISTCDSCDLVSSDVGGVSREVALVLVLGALDDVSAAAVGRSFMGVPAGMM